MAKKMAKKNGLPRVAKARVNPARVPADGEV
ncbi:hypothetical protein PT2222_100090 [Paraburkholderia tropica]